MVSTLLLSGCQLTSPMEVTSYPPADGVEVTLGQIKVRNLLVVADSKGAQGVLSGLVVNDGLNPVTVTFGTQGGTPVTAHVPALSQTRLSGGTSPDATISSVDAPPGALLTMTVGTPASGQDQVMVPVLLPDGYYATVTPGSAPSTSSTPTNTPSLPPPSSTP